MVCRCLSTLAWLANSDLKPVFLDFAELLGTLAPVVSPATQLVVTAVSFLVAQQPAVPMVMAVS